jgi:CBS domain-containing protein
MDVREIMSAPVRTIGADDTLGCAVKLMRDHALGCLPVVDEEGTLVGILTDRDIALAAYEIGEALWRLRVDESMRCPVFTCRAEDGVDAALCLMREQRVHRLPVIDASQKPIGMVSLDDIAHASRLPVLEPIPGVTTDELADAFHATSGRSKHEENRRS